MASDRATFRSEIEATINRCSMENGSNTPDLILAKFLCACLDAFDAGARERETWYGRNDRPGRSAPATPPVAPLETKPKSTCNRHDDCDAADARMKAAGQGRADHCHDDCCEDCFGT